MGGVVNENKIEVEKFNFLEKTKKFDEYYFEKYVYPSPKMEEKWNNFFKFIKKEKPEKKLSFLSFGCGVGWDVYFSAINGFNNIRGLEVQDPTIIHGVGSANEIYPFSREMYKILQIENKIDHYDGNPPTKYKDNQFDVIIFSNSMNRGIREREGVEIAEQSFTERILDCMRISVNEAIWYIIPIKTCFNQKLLMELIKPKNIKILTFVKKMTFIT